MRRKASGRDYYGPSFEERYPKLKHELHEDPCPDCGSRSYDTYGNCIPCCLERRDIKLQREDELRGEP